ncbi:MAG: dihydropteroate synthase [Kiritimatiellia bacterium]
MSIDAFITRLHASGKPLIMGILNRTPDSFSNKGHEATIEDALQMIREGADLLDVGGESTRPGAEEVQADEEIRRTVPYIRALRAQTDLPISIDTRHAAVAEAALDAGADIVNDVTALHYDSKMLPLVLRTRAPVILMHSRGTPKSMDGLTEYEDVVEDVCAALKADRDNLLAQGYPSERIILDPGFGFAKTTEQSMRIISRLESLAALAPVLVGLSRKRMTGGSDETSAQLALQCVRKGARIVRVHNVPLTCRVLAKS